MTNPTLRAPARRYGFFSHSALLGGMKYETEFDWNGVKIFVTSCMVEG